MVTTRGEIGFDALTPKLDINSPLLISAAPGILTFKDGLVLPDGKFYLAAYCDEWRVHMSGIPLNYETERIETLRGAERSATVGGNNNQQQQPNYVVVGYHNGKAVLPIPGNNVRGFAITNDAPRVFDKEVFNVSSFWNGGGMQQFGELTHERQMVGAR